MNRSGRRDAALLVVYLCGLVLLIVGLLLLDTWHYARWSHVLATTSVTVVIALAALAYRLCTKGEPRD